MANMMLIRGLVSLGLLFAVLSASASAVAEPLRSIAAAQLLADDGGEFAAATAQVNAKDLWQSTGVTIQAYSPATVTVTSGLWTHWIGTVPLNAGTGEAYICANIIPANRCNEVMPQVRKGILIGKVNGQTFAIGNTSVIVPSQTGTLYLQINDGSGVGDRADNTGVLTVAITAATSSPPAATLTTPNNGDIMGPATLLLTASTSAGNLIGLEFLVFYDGGWHSLGVDSAAPYQASWQSPGGLRSQLVRFRIDATLSSGEVQSSAGGERRVTFQESIGDPAVVENWVGTRAYLNQRSLDDASGDGDIKCSASSMAMALAMNGLIASDYATLAGKANEMYPRVLSNGVAYIYKMVAELNRQGAIAMYNDGLKRAINASEGWAIIKREVDAGRPVIFRTTQGVMTSAGHILVAVGYQEQGSSRRIIANDPFGQWKGTAANQYFVNTQEPESHVGQWVSYDFDLIFGQYLITVRSPQANPAVQAMAPGTPPDETSDEVRLSGVYEGVTIVDYGNLLFLPVLRK